MRSVELFAGAGGMALGLARAGFRHDVVVEWNTDACDTLRMNQSIVPEMAEWRVHEADVRDVDYEDVRTEPDLLAGGVPCQPFSIAGKHRAYEDKRDMFPEFVRALRTLKPRAFLVENVRGLTRPTFAKYFGYVELMLTYPELQRRGSENWADHLHRLERYHTKGRPDGLFYRVVKDVVNAADFGVPQRRERVLIVGIRSDLHAEFSFPPPTHSQDALLWAQFCSGEYWERHEIPRRYRLKPNALALSRAALLKQSLFKPAEQPWLTVRDALMGLPNPSPVRGTGEPSLTHFQIPGARRYVGHTGSLTDEPAKTLKAGDHGVPGGENMLAQEDGAVRYFTIRESARLQTFPDLFVFQSSWTESMRQIGNAVPVLLAEKLGRKLVETLTRATTNGKSSLQSAGQA